MRVAQIVLVLSGLLLTSYWAGAQNAPVSANESLFYGTFLDRTTSPQKTVRIPGSFKDYANPADATPFQEGKQQIIKTWTDTEGNTYFQVYETITSGPFVNLTPRIQTLERISKDGGTLEFVWDQVAQFSQDAFPKSIRKINPHYRLYTRVGD